MTNTAPTQCPFHFISDEGRAPIVGQVQPHGEGTLPLTVNAVVHIRIPGTYHTEALDDTLSVALEPVEISNAPIDSAYAHANIAMKDKTVISSKKSVVYVIF